MIATADSVTQLGEVAGRVLVAGSHGGLVAAHYAAKARVRAVILNDAGVGLDEAGVAGLRLLESIGMAAAAVDHASARIGDGADMLARGTISRANRVAASLGVAAGMACRDAAVRLSGATLPAGSLPEYREGRFILAEGVHGLDSIGMLREEDAGRVLVIGSHCALHGGRPATALPVDAALAFFNDAGGAISRLAILQERGIPAAAVSCMSARIGDARSMWASGIISFANKGAVARGIAPGKPLALAIGGFCAAREQR
jgi:hypothetical protein